MIWHVVRFDTSSLDETERSELETKLAALAELDVVAWLRVARDIDDPAIVGLLTGFVDEEALEIYRVHPDHLPVVEWVRSRQLPTVRLDVATDDDVTALP